MHTLPKRELLKFASFKEDNQHSNINALNDNNSTRKSPILVLLFLTHNFIETHEKKIQHIPSTFLGNQSTKIKIKIKIQSLTTLQIKQQQFNKRNKKP